MNENEKVLVDNLRLVALKYYSKEDSGVEFTEALSYSFLVKVREGVYINPFNPLEMYPVFESVPYSNTSLSSNWEDYGCKVILVNEIDESGPCYVSYSNEDISKVFEEESVTIGELKEYMFKSKKYFKDRKYLLKERIEKHPIEAISIGLADMKLEEKMLAFFGERGVQLQKVR